MEKASNRARLFLVLAFGVYIPFQFLGLTPAEAGILRSSLRLCSQALTRLTTEGFEGALLFQISRHGLDRRGLSQKFSRPQLKLLLRLLERSNPPQSYSVHWRSALPPEELRHKLEGLGFRVQALNPEDYLAQEGQAIVVAPFLRGLNQLLSLPEIRRVQLLVEMPDGTVAENLAKIDREVLNKLSAGLMDRLLITSLDIHPATAPFLDQQVVLEISGTTIGGSAWDVIRQIQTDRPGQLEVKGIELVVGDQPSSKRSLVYLGVSLEALLELLRDPVFERARLAGAPQSSISPAQK